jgi:hypothetical protein
MTDPADTARGASILAVAQRYSTLTREGRDWCGPCPAGCAREDGFVVSPDKVLSDGRRGAFVCRPAGIGGDVVDLIQHAEACDYLEAVEIILEGDFSISPAEAQIGDLNAARRERNAKLALETWERAQPISESPVALAYFRLRAIGIAAAPEFGGLRFLPNCPWEDENVGRVLRACVIARFTDALTGEAMRSIWRRNITPIALNSEGKGCKWAPPKALGARAGGILRLWPDAVPGPSLAIGEGVETTLSAVELGAAPAPAWAAGDAGALSALPAIGGVERLNVIVDNDPAGQKALRTVGARWREAGRKVRFAAPKNAGEDFNDIARRKAQ